MTRVEIRASVLMGEACFRLGKFADARRAFKAAGTEMPQDRLIAFGEEALDDGWFADARKAFEAAAAIEFGQATL